MMKNNCNLKFNEVGECIRQGEIFKYSNKKKNFIKKTLILNKEELIYKDDKKKSKLIYLPRNKYYSSYRHLWISKRDLY